LNLQQLSLINFDTFSLVNVIRNNTGITNIQDNVFFTNVPEPSGLLLFLTALAGIVYLRSNRPEGQGVRALENNAPSSSTLTP
jgi:hypothetical protein